jgi:hypothetical protein
MHMIGAVFFLLLAGVSGTYGLLNIFAVQQTLFGPASVGPTLPTLQLLLCVVLIVVAVVSARACTHCYRRYTAGKNSSG